MLQAGVKPPILFCKIKMAMLSVFRILSVKKSYFIFIQKIIPPAVYGKHVLLLKVMMRSAVEILS